MLCRKTFLLEQNMKLGIINIWIMGFWLYSSIYCIHIMLFAEIILSGKYVSVLEQPSPQTFEPPPIPNLGTSTWTSKATSLTRWHCLNPNSRGLALTRLTLKIILWNYNRTEMICSQKNLPQNVSLKMWGAENPFKSLTTASKKLHNSQILKLLCCEDHFFKITIKARKQYKA